jgi:surface antigen Omp85-like protein
VDLASFPLALALALAAGEPIVETPLEVDRWHFAAFPIASYASDVGLTVGGALFMYAPVTGHPDEQDALTLSASYATRGPRQADAGWVHQRLFGWPLRFRLNLHVGDEPFMPYWGEGAQLGGLGVPTGSGTPPEVYRYHDRRFFAAAVLRGPIVGAFGWHVRARFLDVAVPEQSALLAESAPPGAHGGRVALFEAGLLFDTRDREVGPRSGVLLAAAAFAAPQLHGVSDFAFHGYDASARAYVPLPLGATLALRALYDHKLSGVPGRSDAAEAVPFFERALYEGITFGEGLGGASTIRGVARYRVSGDEKALGSAELRIALFSTHLLGKTQDFGVDGGIDAGRARQPGYPTVDATGFAVGLRFVWDHAVIARVEMGRALHGGDQTLYISFGDQF